MSREHNKLNPLRWSRVRWAVLRRDKYLCQSCGRAGRLEVDHVTALHLGGDPWALGNLQTLCRSCHFSKTSGENKRRRVGGPIALRWQEFSAEIQD